MSHLPSDQEEVDTKLILHALDATNAGATNAGATNLQINSPDTDVLVRALRPYPQLGENTVFVTGAAQRRRMIPLKLIYDDSLAKNEQRLYQDSMRCLERITLAAFMVKRSQPVGKHSVKALKMSLLPLQS